MAPPRNKKQSRPARAREAKLAFEALSIEGGLLSPDWLARVAALEADEQKDVDYGVPSGLALRDELGRYWRMASAEWHLFSSGLRLGGEKAALSTRFVRALLQRCLGFSSLQPVPPAVVQGRSFPLGHAALAGRVPVVIAPAGLGLDTPSLEFGDGTKRRTAFGLAQEYLNAADGAAWGLATDGLTLRVLRDNASLTRPAWIEADLQRIFTEERFADFTALYLLVHESRFGREGAAPTDAPLERWRTAGREEGTRAREHLRDGVEAALLALGEGFLAHPANQRLRERLEGGALGKEAFFQQLLRLVYRLLFLLTAEERGLLHAPDAPEATRRLYAEGYGLARLRERSVRRSAHDRNADLWEGQKIVLRALAQGESRLGLPALAGLFATDACPDLDAARLQNRHLLGAIYRLGWIHTEGALARVNWRDMGPEELGSVYESLLELVPQVNVSARSFLFATGGETKGNARKTSGSYYTPDSLVQVLLDSALEPVVEETIAKHPEAPAEALLQLSVVDPACGSGHFLLAAARRLAGHVARLEAGGTPTVLEYRHALRRVVGRCLFGVDLNPMAIELCKVSLWMEAIEPGTPLTFLDAHLRQGNALLGTTKALMAGGIPDAAWEPIEGDDKKRASALKKKNKAEAAGQRTLDFAAPPAAAAGDVAKQAAAVDAADDASLASLHEKSAKWAALVESEPFLHQQLVADAWCAAFVWPKSTDEDVSCAPTAERWRLLRDGKPIEPRTIETVRQLAQQYQFFHWELAFPQVFGRGGFDVVLGNPPWDMNEVKDNEFFAVSFPEILAVRSAKEKAGVLERIASEAPDLIVQYRDYVRATEGVRHHLMEAGRFPLSAVGRLNLYRLFIELGSGAIRADGVLAIVIPSGFASDSFSQEHFVALHSSGRLRSFYDFENADALFPAVHRSFRFALMTVGGRDLLGHSTDFVFRMRTAEELRESTRHVRMSSADVEVVNPLTKTAPLFRNVRDQSIVLQLHRHAVVLGELGEGGWPIAQVLMFMMNASMTEHRAAEEFGADSNLVGNHYLADGEDWEPLYEGKMVGMYDHRAATVVFDATNRVRRNQAEYLSDAAHADATRLAVPMFWVPSYVADLRRGSANRWHLCVKDVTGAGNERTCIASLLPQAALTDSVPWLKSELGASGQAFLLSNLNAIACDFAAKNKVAGLHLRGHYLAQLPLIGPEALSRRTPFTGGDLVGSWVTQRVLELTYTAWDLESFARDVLADVTAPPPGPATEGFAAYWHRHSPHAPGTPAPSPTPFRWDPERRFLLRCELDAAFFHLYGLSRDDTAYILDTFPIVKKNDEKAHGEFRTKRVILELYDAMADAARTGTPFQTRLDPPPADPRVAHPASTRPDWADALLAPRPAAAGPAPAAKKPRGRPKKAKE